MKRFWLGLAATAAVSACSGGNPFETETDTETPVSGIPDVIAGDLGSVIYDPVAQTLIVKDLSLDESPAEAEYRRRANLDRGGYEAYTAQDSPLQRHTTAYVRDINGTRAAVVVTGGQFEHYFGGATYGRSGAFDPPPIEQTPQNKGLVSYAGNYVGLVNGPGDGGDLQPVAPGTSGSVRPVDAGEVTGRVLINADFVDNVVNGQVFDRSYVDEPGLAMNDLALQPTAIDPNTGTFSGELTINLQNHGTYGGIFGGPDSEAVAGALKATDHIDNVSNEEEYGIFVLNRCGTPGQDALCNQPTP
jgi:hypothetical protein